MKLFLIKTYNYENIILVKRLNTFNAILTDNNEFLRLGLNNWKNDFSIDSYSKTIMINSKNDCINEERFRDVNYLFACRFKKLFFKIRFNGKGFRIQSFKNKKILNFTFGHSHRFMLKLRKNFFKRISKYKYFFYITDKKILNKLKIMFNTIKPINKYTLRGLRLSRCIITKRKGRKSPNL